MKTKTYLLCFNSMFSCLSHVEEMLEEIDLRHAVCIPQKMEVIDY